MLKSVNCWQCEEDPSINSWDIAEEVNEWWMWGDMRQELYFSGYVGTKAWIVDVHAQLVRWNFGTGRRSKWIGKRENQVRDDNDF